MAEPDSMVPGGGREALLGELLAWRDQAYLTALRVTCAPALAEDAVQDAYVRAVEHLRKSDPPEEPRAWFLSAVANCARNCIRTESRLRRRGQAMDHGEPTREPVSGELVAALRTEMDRLEERFRLPISLCFEQGLSQREAALALGCPQGTVAANVSRGLDRLREALSRKGHAALAPAVLIGGLAQAAPAAPAGLAAAIEGILSGGVAATGGGVGSAALHVSARLGAKKTLGLALGWKLAAAASLAVAAIATPMALSTRSGGRAPAVRLEDDVGLAAAAARCRTVADLRALAPRIRAATGRMMAEPGFAPERVVGLEFADVAARRARGDWEVPAAATAIRIALEGSQARLDSAALQGQWRSAFAQSCRLRQAGQHHQALETIMAASWLGPDDWHRTVGGVAAVLIYLDDPESCVGFGAALRDGSAGTDARSLAALLARTGELDSATNDLAPACRLAALWSVAHATDSLPDDDVLRAALADWLQGATTAGGKRAVNRHLFRDDDNLARLPARLVAEGRSATEPIIERIDSFMKR